MMDFLPVSRKEMNERGWDQVDFVYISGDAYVDHPSLVMPSSQGCWNPVATEWESLHSRTGSHLTASRFLENHVLDFLYPQEIWTLWSTIILYPKSDGRQMLTHPEVLWVSGRIMPALSTGI